MLNVTASRIQYWVRELRDLFPSSAEPGRKRTFSRQEVENIFQIGRWLIDDRCTLAAARQRLLSTRADLAHEDVAASPQPSDAPQPDPLSLIHARPDNLQDAQRLISHLQQALSVALSPPAQPTQPTAPTPPPPAPIHHEEPRPISGPHRKVHPIFTLDPATPSEASGQWRAKYEALQAQLDARTEELAALRARYAQLEALLPASTAETAQALTDALEERRKLSQKLDYQVQYQRKLSRDVRAQLLALIELARTF